MYITFYDRNFKALADNSSQLIESYSRTRRAYDLNEFSCVCEPLTIDAQPVFGVIRKNNGDYDYAVLNPVLDIDNNNKGNLSCRDLKAVFNTEILYNFAECNAENLQDFLVFLFNNWRMYDNCGFNVEIRFATTCKDIKIIENTLPIDKGIYNTFEVMKKIFSVYDLFMTTKLNIRGRRIVCNIGSTKGNIKNLNIDEYPNTFGRVAADINTAIAYKEDYSQSIRWYLLSDNSITQDESKRDIFPSRAKIFKSSSLEEASYDAVGQLAENRYQDQIDINIFESANFDRLRKVDFDTSFKVYSKGKFYKTLPIGEIIDNEKHEMTIKIGYKPISLIQIK